MGNQAESRRKRETKKKRPNYFLEQIGVGLLWIQILLCGELQLIGIFLIFSAISGELTSDFSMNNLSGLFIENKFFKEHSYKKLYQR